MAPRLPTLCPSYCTHWAWAASSITSSPCSFAMAFNAFMGAGCPAKCTGMMAFVRGVSAASTADGSRQKVSRSTSTMMGVALHSTTALAVATNVYAGTITSSPASIPPASKATRNATVPLHTAMPCLVP